MAGSSTETFTASNSRSPKITFWTNHGCPFAQRVQIVLKELGLPYEEVLIDLDKPREQWYLKINPRGTVPALRYTSSSGSIKDEIITESAIVAQFLADAHPSHLLPASNDSATAALFRARVGFFVDTYFTKVQPFCVGMMVEASKEERERKGDELVRAVEREIEPLLVMGDDAWGPYFGGSESLTLAEALVAPFLQRLYDFADDDIFPASVPKKLDQLPNFSKWVKACRSHASVAFNWQPEAALQYVKEKMGKRRQTTTNA